MDLRETTSLPFTGEIHAVAHEISETRKKVHFNICAVVATTDALYGMMRMFAVVAGRYFTVVQVFRVAAEAEEWLASQRLLAK